MTIAPRENFCLTSCLVSTYSDNQTLDGTRKLPCSRARRRPLGAHPRLLAVGLLVLAGALAELGGWTAIPVAAAQPSSDFFSKPPVKSGDKPKPSGPSRDAEKPSQQPPNRSTPAPGSIDPALTKEGRELFGHPKDTATGDDPNTAAGSAGWGIMLETFKGKDAAAQATQRLGQVSAQLKRDDIEVRATEAGAALILGSYAKPGDAAAQRDLKMIREFEASPGFRPYSSAFMAPPAGHDRGAAPEMDLATVRRRLGADPGELFTLQIAVYETPDKPDEAKRTAEKAAKVLRDQGERAFYHHGPRRSMVTIGLFSERDVDRTTGRAMNPEITRLKQAYPLNLLNGQYPIKMGESGQQPSQLVKVP